MKTKDEWKQYILFMLLDFNLDKYNYAGIDFDGEITVCAGRMKLTHTSESPANKYWIHSDRSITSGAGVSFNTDVFVGKANIPDNYYTMLFKL